MSPRAAVHGRSRYPADANAAEAEGPYSLVFGLWTIILLLSTSILGMSLIAAGLSVSATPQIILLGLGTGLLTTTVFSVLQSFMQTSSLLRYLQSGLRTVVEPQLLKISDELGAGTSRLIGQIAELRTDFLPDRDYAPSNRPSIDLNSDMTASLQSSDSYLFVGLSGGFMAVRLHEITEYRLYKVTAILADPKRPDAIERRIRLEPQRPENLEQTLHGIAMTVVALVDLQGKFPNLELFMDAPPLNRIELFPGAVYLTLFGDTADTRYRFPRTSRFGSRSALYRTYSREAEYLTSREERIRLPTMRDPDAVSAWLSQIMGSPYSASDVEHLRHGFQRKCEAVRQGESG